MSAVILDSNIFIRATALEHRDDESALLNSSRHDRDSDPEKTSGMSPRQCRALICTQLLPHNKIIMPVQQADEILKVVGGMRAQHRLAPHNEALIGCIEQFVRNASMGHRVPVLTGHIHQQHDVLKEALSIAASVAESGPAERRHRASIFIRKNQDFLLATLPEPNIEKVQRGRSPFVWTDWLLCHAAKRAGTVVATMDRDFEYLTEGFVKVTGYNPTRYMEYYPESADVKDFRAAFEMRREVGPPPI